MATANGLKDMRCARTTIAIMKSMSMDMPVERIGGAVLAGGRSSRMGSDKACLPFGDARLVDHVAHLMTRTGCSPVLVSGKVDGYSCIGDLIAGAGPVGGIYSISQAAIQEEYPSAWLFVPVDMPLLSTAVLARLTSCPAGFDGACFAGRPLPLFLRLNGMVTGALRQSAMLLTKGRRLSVRQLLAGLRIHQAECPQEEMVRLANANTPEEWERITA